MPSTTCAKASKGARCSINGKAYEVLVAGVCKRVRSQSLTVPLNTQCESQLGGCTVRCDLVLNVRAPNDTHVEVKGKNAPDWIQTSIIPKRRRWTAKPSSLLPKQTVRVFEKLLTNKTLFKGRLPPFMTRDHMTYTEWSEEAPNFSDEYIACPDDTIATAYRARGVHYIQIKNHGLFHTGKDVSGFGVPMFKCSQRLRVRCKRHGKKCRVTGIDVPSSIMASLRPILSTLPQSPYSLDDLHSLPQDFKPPQSHIKG